MLWKYLRKKEGTEGWKEGREGMHSWAAQVWQVRHQIDSEQREGILLLIRTIAGRSL